MPQRSIKFLIIITLMLYRSIEVFIRSIDLFILLPLMPQRSIKFLIIITLMLYRSIEVFISSIEPFIFLNLMFQLSTKFSISLHLSFKLLSEPPIDRIRDGELSFKVVDVGAGMLVLKS